MSAPKPDKRTEQDIIAYLRAHPDFLKRHSELLAVLAPPARQMGDSVVDFQAFQLKNLQKNTANIQSEYNGLLDHYRDTLFAQQQVHDAALRLIRVRGLEPLLEVITVDLASLFGVDVIRLAVESEDSGWYGVQHGEFQASGIVVVPPGTTMALLGNKKAIAIENAETSAPPALDEIFADCPTLARSVALLSLDMPQLERHALLAFGAREEGHFRSGHPTELLVFLARIVAHQLELFLGDLA